MNPVKLSAWLGFVGTILVAYPGLRAARILRLKNTASGDPANRFAQWSEKINKGLDEMAQAWPNHIFYSFIIGIVLLVVSSGMVVGTAMGWLGD